MPNVEFKIRSKSYSIACAEGEQEHIRKLAKNLNVRADAIARTFGSASEGLILAITALMMEDEINTMQQNGGQSAQNPVNEAEQADKINNALVDAIDPIAKYIENLAKRIEKS